VPHLYDRFPRVVSADEMRTLDRAAIQDFGVPSLTLMENAARGVADAVIEGRRSGTLSGTAVAVCGPGNNGGDGFAAVRLLKAQGVVCRAIALADSYSGDAVTNLEAFRKAGGDIAPFAGAIPVGSGDVVLDAVFGTGLSRAPEGVFAKAIEAINASRRGGARVISVDIPSGLSADTGRPLGACVEADCTITFGYAKQGLVVYPGRRLCGALKVVDIGIPPAAEKRLSGPRSVLLDAVGVRSLIPVRDPDSHKGTFGHLLVVAGSPDKAGAAAMVSKAALRGGVGLCTVAARTSVVERVVAIVPEAMGRGLSGAGPLGLQDMEAIVAAARGKSALVVGPGLELGAESGSFIADLLGRTHLPSIVDADGLNALSSPALIARVCNAGSPLIFTPHPGEMARLLGTPIDEVQRERLGVARAFARERNVTLVLKGAATVIATRDGTLAVNPTGNAGMATAGTGDVLSGLLGALLAQGLPPEAAAAVGVFVHGAAGDRVARRRGLMGLMATDVVDGMTEVWAEWNV
jgi:ADP-dependent NAD(P)H-hydrate dehydratase / NAD(P)H-hydrate epimerase